MSERFPVEASPADAQAVFDAIDATLNYDDAMPQGRGGARRDLSGVAARLDFHFDRHSEVQLIPVDGLKELAVRRRADVPTEATVFRETPKPELGPDASELEVFRLHKESDGTARISKASDTCLEENEIITLSSFMDARRLEKLTGADRVSAVACQALARQIRSTRVHPVQPYPDEYFPE